PFWWRTFLADERQSRANERPRVLRRPGLHRGARLDLPGLSDARRPGAPGERAAPRGAPPRKRGSRPLLLLRPVLAELGLAPRGGVAPFCRAFARPHKAMLPSRR